MTVKGRIRRICRRRTLRSSRIIRVASALSLLSDFEKALASIPTDSFSYASRTHRCEVESRLNMLSTKCSETASIYRGSRQGSLAPFRREYRSLRNRLREISDRDERWASDAALLRREFSGLLEESNSYEGSVRERLMYHQKALNLRLESAVKALDPDTRLSEARRVLDYAKSDLEIPRIAVLRIEKLPDSLGSLCDSGLRIEPVRTECTELKSIVTAARRNLRAGNYALAGSQAEAAERLTIRIRERLLYLFETARGSQEEWLRLASVHDAFGVKFAHRISEVRDISDPYLMIPRWKALSVEISEYALHRACETGNLEQQALMNIVGQSNGVRWSPRLDAEELIRFAKSCVGERDMPTEDAQEAVGATQKSVAKRRKSASRRRKSLPSLFITDPPERE